jgi:uncharacterized membrane protein HdeD (DUF308 family)
MFDELTRRWWIVAGRGLVALVFGVALFTSRVEALTFLVVAFGIFALADGIFTAGAGLAVGWMAMFLEGIVGMAIGAFTLLYPPAVFVWFVPLIVAWAVVTGVLELAGVRRLHRVAHGETALGEWLLAASGIASILFGIVFALRPDLGALTGILAVYAIVSGVLLIAFAMNVRTWPRIAPPAAA